MTSSSQAYRRAVRRPVGRARVTERDLGILEFVATCQPVTTSQIGRYIGASTDMTLRRLRLLRDHGLVAVHVSSLNDENRYTLTRSGRSELCSRLGQRSEQIRVQSGVGRVHLLHHEGVIDMYLAVRAAPPAANWSLQSFSFDGDIRKTQGQRGRPIPDAGAVFNDAIGTRLALLFEVDRGTESPKYMLKTKFAPYLAWFETGEQMLGCSHWRICCVVPGRKRLCTLAETLWDFGIPEGLWYFVQHEEMVSSSFDGEIWYTPREVDSGRTARIVREHPFKTVKTDGQSGVDGHRGESLAMTG